MAKDKVNPNDSTLDALCLKQGDVVCVMPDGHPWTQKELTNPNWRIIRVPNMPNDLRNQATEAGTPKAGTLTQARKYTIDLASPHVTAAFSEFFLDDTRSTPIYETSIPTESLYEIRKPRPDRDV